MRRVMVCVYYVSLMEWMVGCFTRIDMIHAAVTFMVRRGSFLRKSTLLLLGASTVVIQRAS